MSVISLCAKTRLFVYDDDDAGFQTVWHMGWNGGRVGGKLCGRRSLKGETDKYPFYQHYVFNENFHSHIQVRRSKAERLNDMKPKHFFVWGAECGSLSIGPQQCVCLCFPVALLVCG